MKNSVFCGAYFRAEAYKPSNVIESNMGHQCKDQVRLAQCAAPSLQRTLTEQLSAAASGIVASQSEAQLYVDGIFAL